MSRSARHFLVLWVEIVKWNQRSQRVYECTPIRLMDVMTPQRLSRVRTQCQRVCRSQQRLAVALALALALAPGKKTSYRRTLGGWGYQQRHQILRSCTRDTSRCEGVDLETITITSCTTAFGFKLLISFPCVPYDKFIRSRVKIWSHNHW